MIKHEKLDHLPITVMVNNPQLLSLITLFVLLTTPVWSTPPASWIDHGTVRNQPCGSRCSSVRSSKWNSTISHICLFTST